MNRTTWVSPEELERQRQFALRFRALPDRPKTYYIVTFGCQMNAHDSEKLAGMLDEMGMEPAPAREQADLVLHNTCCIRDNAERKALGNVTWLKELKKERPQLLIGVCGCMIQQPDMAEKVLRQYPFIDLAFGTSNQHELPEMLYRACESAQRIICTDPRENLIAESVPIHRSDPRQAYVTIMYGCNNYCSYCIVPYVRGRERSRRRDDILREVDALVQGGTQEIMLLGQNVNSYGNDSAENVSFAQLLRDVARSGIPRVRFMTSHPKDLSDALIDVMASEKAVMRHFHLPVQSGSNEILKRMNRRYTRESYLERLSALRGAMPDIGVTTDLIVAFPGETDAQFEETMELVREAHFDSAFTFIYSPRRGTAAAAMEGRIPDDIATERIEKLIALQQTETEKVFSALQGSRTHVLVTGRAHRNENQMTGKCERNISINFPGEEELTGRIVPVTVTGSGKTTLRGRLEEEGEAL